MTLRADRPTQADRDIEPPGIVPDIADEIADMLRRGRWSGVSAVRRVSLTLSDGRKVVFDLPNPKGLEPEPEPEPLTDMESAVIEVINRLANGTQITTEEIAKRSGYTASGKLRDFIKSLAKSGRLKRTSTGFEKVC